MRKIFELFNNFNGKNLVVISTETNQELFKVEVDIKQLPHLLGLHYVYPTKKNSEIINEIKNGILTLKKIEADYLKSRRTKNTISLNGIRDRINQFNSFLLRLSNEEQLYLKIDRGINELNNRRATLCILYPKTSYNQQYLQLFLGENIDESYLYLESFIPASKPKFSGEATEVQIKIE